MISMCARPYVSVLQNLEFYFFKAHWGCTKASESLETHVNRIMDFLPEDELNYPTTLQIAEESV